MTEAVNQNQRGSVLVPTILGAGAGVGGYFAADRANFGIKTAGYNNWDDVVADTNKDDKFFKNLADKANDNDVKGAYQKVETNLRNYRDAEKGLTDLLKEGADREVLKAVSNADESLATAEENLFNKVKNNRAKFGIADDAADDVIRNKIDELKVLADDALDATVKEEVKAVKNANDAVEKAVKAVRDKADDIAKESGKIENVIKQKRAFAKTSKECAKDVTGEVLQKVKFANKWLNVALFAAGGLLAGLGINALIKNKE